MPALPHPHPGYKPRPIDQGAPLEAEAPASRLRRSSFDRHRRTSILAILTTLAPLLISCASPGPPRPPSLHLVAIPTDLTAQRVGSNVLLLWTTPARTTDGLAVPDPLTAEICREPNPSTAPTKQPTATACPVVLRAAVTPGLSTASDPLPASLTADPASPIAYRIRILNPNSRSAGLSTPAIALAGAAPPPVAGLRAIPTRNGVLLEWQPSAQPSLVELRRDLLADPNARPATPGIKPGMEKRDLLDGTPPPSSATTVLRAEGDRLSFPRPDPGGTFDRTAQRTQTYRYIAQRIRTVPLNGHLYELRSELSSPLTVKLADTFPPLTPAGLAAVPSDDGTPPSPTPTIDLSWEPDPDPDLAGYNVYRRTASGTFQRITRQPVRGPAFTDPAVTPGTAYTYRVTAVDNTGNESPPSAEVTETPHPRQ